MNNYINTNPEILYDNIYETHDSVRIVESEGKFGLIDKSGQELVKMEYDCISPFKKDLFLVDLNSKCGIYDNHGNIKVPIKYNSIWDIDNNNLFQVSDNEDNIGAYDYNLGVEVIPCKYGNWHFKTSEYNIVLKSNESNKQILYNRNGKIISNNQYDDILINDYNFFSINFKGGSLEYPIVMNGDKYGLIDTNGTVLISPIFEDIFPFNEGLAGFRVNGKYGFVDTKGNIVISPKYEKVESFREGLACVQLNGKLGFIDKKEKNVIPFIYDTINFYSHGGIEKIGFFKGLTCVKRNKKWGIIDSIGNIVLPFIHDEIYCTEMFSDSFKNKSKEFNWILKLKNKYGFYNPSNKMNEIKYDYLGLFSNGLASFRLNGKYGFLNTKGKVTIPAKFEDAGDFSGGLSYVVLNEKVGFINKQGKIVIPCIYKKNEQGLVNDFYGNEFLEVILNDEIIYINKKGRTISDCN